MSVIETKTRTGEPAPRKVSLPSLGVIVLVCGASAAMLGWIGLLTWIVLTVVGF